MSNYIVIGFPGSGKSELAKLFKKKKENIVVVEIGDLVRKKYNSIILKSEYESLIDYANYVFSNNRYLEFVKMINLKHENDIIFVGPRTAQEIDYLCEKFDVKRIIGLVCKKDERYRRRLNQEKYIDEEYFNKRDIYESQWGLEKTFELCDEIYDTSLLTPNEIYQMIISDE
jgi:dephospho-CoA kinase